MKSSEAREICAKTRSGSEAQLYQTVMECIADRAKTGSESAKVYLQTLWHKDLIDAVKKRLKEEGYRVRYSYIDDQRDGDCHVLDISWREDAINKKANHVTEDVIKISEKIENAEASRRYALLTIINSDEVKKLSQEDRDTLRTRLRAMWALAFTHGIEIGTVDGYQKAKNGEPLYDHDKVHTN